ncbi:DUF5683 domain-containing protein [Psychroserpens sp. NJDZ02]|uniref:DUF5683 domain-containing protein n=1 Tax=Psychroserpens sp. NJDZ02 TaxID=2570561 RepID=UPI0010A78784|nr:DUF5683 domain-containing protein [Psychroserpens sp. NJDZ02]QCE42105.1 hypothetical protein E9099_12055 [Psychroserpens sp. NJDZ02]
MVNKSYFICLVFCLFCALSFAQDDSTATPADSTDQSEELPKVLKQKKKKKADKPIIIDTDVLKKTRPYDPLAPSKASFYSAILPGLGQAYNGKYWKIPIVYIALGTGVYFYVDNNKQYNRARDAYKRRLAGYSDDEFQGRLTDDALRSAQTSYRRNKELSLLVTIGFYALNILDANVDAHLLQYNISDDLSLRPNYRIEEFDNEGRVGLSLNFQF